MADSDIQLLLVFTLLLSRVALISADTAYRDVLVLQNLMKQWQNLPPSWGKTKDPCGAPWEGVICTNFRVTELVLSSMNLKGTLSADIGGLLELISLDLSFNQGLTGSLSPRIGDLKMLTFLSLQGCGLTGSIPREIGQLAKLSFLALNLNNFSGSIPPTLGSLSKLILLDLADNRLTGSIPVSTATTPGLDQLLKAKHFHFNNNQLSGGISAKLFSSEMVLLHVLLNGNRLTGRIPDTLGNVKTLEVLRLDKNSLSGSVPSNLNNLTVLTELYLSNNQLTGPVPDLTRMNALSYVDLSNNSFDPSEAPRWFSTIQSLTTLVMENGNLQGPVPQMLFSFPQLQQVKLKGNHFNDSLDMGNSLSEQLQLVDFEDNQISSVKLSSEYKNVIILKGNPVCDDVISETTYCLPQQQREPYSTSLENCDSKSSCPPSEKRNPQSCECAVPYEGTLVFRAPPFRDLTNATVFGYLEKSLWSEFELTPGSVSIESILFDKDGYIRVHLGLFPPHGKYFSRMEIIKIGHNLSSYSFEPRPRLGTYYFDPSTYPFPGKKRGTSVSLGVIIGIAVGGVLLFLILIMVGVYAVWQKKRAERAIEDGKSFDSWAPGRRESVSGPQLKGARWFSYDELKKSTNNFSDSNEVGSGGYGKVYRGILSNGQVVAIKRAQQGSMQGGLEFRTEIELLSRVHHKNLVSLVGFCFEKGEQMLVYEYIPNGTIRASLSGKSGIYLDWKRRLQITLGSARGLAYLHEHANPPIIHRDIKTTNILLDECLTAKVADFGLSKLVQEDGKGHVSTQVKGTMGYLDPEYYTTQQLTEKSDVYSFGVVMLELVTARQPIEKGKYIVREVRTRLDKHDKQHYGLKELLDPNIKIDSSLTGFGRFIELAMECLQESAADRPTMSDMVKEIETMLHNGGLDTHPASESSSATEFGNVKGGHGNPHSDVEQKKDAINSESFHYSGGFSPLAEVHPK